MKKRLLSILAVFTVGILFIACEGDVGPEGAKGDTGATGSKGVTGDKGDTGTPGAAGSSVLFVSDFSGGEMPAGVNQGVGWNLTDSQTTFAQAPSSVIMVYLKVPDGAWARVPGTIFGTTGRHTFAVSFHDNQGMTQVIARRTKGSGVFSFEAARIIVIKSGANARQTPVDYDDYEAVKNYYNLAD